MTDIPRVSIDETQQLNEQDREALAFELEQLARRVRTGWLSIPPGMPSSTYRGQPVQNVVVELVHSRPKV